MLIFDQKISKSPLLTKLFDYYADARTLEKSGEIKNPKKSGTVSILIQNFWIFEFRQFIWLCQNNIAKWASNSRQAQMSNSIHYETIKLFVNQ